LRFLLILAAVVFLTACADSHQLLRTNNTAIKLDSSKSIYISIPMDGRYERINYPGSGINTAQILLIAFAKYSGTVQTGHAYQSFDRAFARAKSIGYGYLVFPTLLEWEDRATEWSAIPDKASIKIEIVDLQSGRTIDSAIIRGKSGIATLGGDHPQDLLAKPVDEYVATLF